MENQPDTGLQKMNATFSQCASEWDKADTPPAPVVAESPPQPAPQPAPVVQQRPPDRFDQHARDLRIQAYVDEHPVYKDSYTEMEREYQNAVDEMAEAFKRENDPAQVEEKFTKPLKGNFTPDQLPDEWHQEQLSLLKNISKVERAKMEVRWQKVREKQQEKDRKAQEIRQRYDADQQQLAVANQMNIIAVTSGNLLNKEPEFSELRSIRDAASKGDNKQASERWEDIKANVFAPALVQILQDEPNLRQDLPTATYLAMKAAQKVLRRKRGAPVVESPQASPAPFKSVGKSSKESLESAFANWTPAPPEKDAVWDSTSNSYRRRGR